MAKGTNRARDSRNYNEDMHGFASKAMADHMLEKVTDRSWSIARPNSSSYRTEIVLLEYGRVIVHGDIAPVLFERTWETGIEALKNFTRRDIGEVERKVRDGGSTLDDEVFASDLIEYAKDRYHLVQNLDLDAFCKKASMHKERDWWTMLDNLRAWKQYPRDEYTVLLNIGQKALLKWCAQQIVQDKATAIEIGTKLMDHDVVDVECLSSFGKVVKSEVFYAYHAMKKCVELVEALPRQTPTAPQDPPLAAGA